MSEKVKHVPTRKCIHCKASKPKEQLWRIVKYNDEIFVDKTYKAEGRGAYICRDAECLKAAIKARRLEKAFRTKVPAEIYDALEKLSVNMEV